MIVKIFIFQLYLLITCIAFLFACGEAHAELLINEKTEYHDVYQTTPEKLAVSVVEIMRPICQSSGHAIGCKSSNHTSNYKYIGTSGNKCKIETLKLTLNITYHLPRWVNADKMPEHIQEQWNKTLQHLTEHEKRHGEDTKTVLKAAHDEILALETHCTSLKRRVKKIQQHASDKDYKLGKKLDAKEGLFPIEFE